MNKLLLILVYFLFSCGNNSGKPPVKKQDALGQAKLDTNRQSAFNWSWERSGEKIILPLSVTRYISKGQEPMDTFSGDINNDGIRDLVLVTRTVGEDTITFSRDYLLRELLVFSGQQDRSQKFLFKNTKALPCRTCCGMSDPYGGMTVKTGQIIVNEYCGSNLKAVSEYRFGYNGKRKDWLLDTIVTESYAFYYEQYRLDTTTQKDFGLKSLRTFSLYNDEE